MKAYMCHWCKRIYLAEKPSMCRCRSNAFLEEYKTTESELESLEERGAQIVNPIIISLTEEVES